MAKPAPVKIEPAEVRKLALGVLAADRFPYLATIDGDQPRLRPVSPVRTDEFTVYIANLRLYHKTGEIAANPRVELCYLDDGHNQVRIEDRLRVGSANWSDGHVPCGFAAAVADGAGQQTARPKRVEQAV